MVKEVKTMTDGQYYSKLEELKIIVEKSKTIEEVIEAIERIQESLLLGK